MTSQKKKNVTFQKKSTFYFIVSNSSKNGFISNTESYISLTVGGPLLYSKAFRLFLLVGFAS